MQNVADTSLEEAAAAIKAGRLSPVDALEACLSRLSEVEPTVRAFASIDTERARREAASLDRELREDGPRSVLHGIPVGVKDVIDVDGMPTRAGSHVLDDEPLPEDAPVIKRIREAGAIVLGKTTTHEFAAGISTPPTRNPWDPSRIPGGSSGGSGAAVALGECLAALGTDSGGSIRVPAAYCGVSGLRPRLDTVPPEGIIPLSWTHDTCGPMARSALDLAHVWSVMAEDPDLRTDLPVSETTIGVLHPIRSMLDVRPEVEEATTSAAAVLEGEGARLKNVELPPFQQWDGPRKTVVVSDMLAMHKEAGWYPDRKDRYGEGTLAFMEGAEKLTGTDLALAHRTLRALRRMFLSVFEQVDVVLIPTTLRAAPTWEEAERTPRPSEEPSDGAYVDTRPLPPQVLRATGPIGWCGLAAVTIPVGFSPEGMPLGLQIVAGDESRVLSVAARYQAVTDFHRARPPLDRLASA